MTERFLIKQGVTLGLGLIALFLSPPASADGRWGFYLGNGGAGFSYHGSNTDIHINSGPGYSYAPVYPYPAPPPRYYPSYNYSYYPRYDPNPVVRRDVTDRGYYAPDGTFHSDTTVEDRRASYYSPGRNQAITRPRTTVTRSYGPDGTWRTVEHTTWIGADGRPHSTTIERETSEDLWGNTHTDTHVTLKNRKSGAGQSEEGSHRMAPSTQGGKKPKTGKKR